MTHTDNRSLVEKAIKKLKRRRGKLLQSWHNKYILAKLEDCSRKELEEIVNNYHAAMRLHYEYDCSEQAALQNQQPSVNQQTLEALKFYANPENYCEDYEVNYPFRDTKINFDKGSKAAIAIASAESSKPDPLLLMTKEQWEQAYKTTEELYSFLNPDPRDAIIQKLKEGLEFYKKHCPKNSLDGVEGTPTAFMAINTLAEVEQIEKRV